MTINLTHLDVCPGQAQPPDPSARRAAAAERLRKALLSFEEGFQPGTYDDVTGGERQRAAWRGLVSAAGTPQVCMPLCRCLHVRIASDSKRT
jgi:hypothetical protein